MCTQAKLIVSTLKAAVSFCTANIPPLAFLCFTHIFITGCSTLQEAVVARLFVHPSVNMCVEEGASKRDGAGGGVENRLL